MDGVKRPVRIAHAYGNSRRLLRRALESPADMIEADIWYRGGDIYVRHERRTGPLPVLVDRQMRGHRLPPLSLVLWRGYYLRPEFPPFKLGQLLDAVRDKKRLLLDVKGKYPGRQVGGFAWTLARTIAERNDWGQVSVCGQTYPVLDRLREAAPQLEVRYSIERADQWKAFKRMAREDGKVRAICIEHRFITAKRARFIEEKGIDLYCWTVDDPAEAKRLVAEGADGIISNDLRLLAEL